LVAGAIELKFVEFDDLGRQSGRHILVAEYSTSFSDRKEVAYFQAVPASPDIYLASPVVHCSAPGDSGYLSPGRQNRRGEEKFMTRRVALRILTGTLGVVLLVTIFSPWASASCGDASKFGPNLHRQSWQDSDSFPFGSLLRIADDSDPIVGMWHVTFTAQGNENGPPDGTPIDNSLVTWHSDGTELMNSARPPQDGDFCMGVWKKNGKNTYKLNHFAWLANDTANAPGGIGNPTGPTRILQQVTLSPDGKHYSGTFTLDAYDTSGTQVAHIVGVVAATRITINTTVSDLL
jgi:hypothetical protein